MPIERSTRTSRALMRGLLSAARRLDNLLIAAPPAAAQRLVGAENRLTADASEHATKGAPIWQTLVQLQIRSTGAHMPQRKAIDFGLFVLAEVRLAL